MAVWNTHPVSVPRFHVFFTPTPLPQPGYAQYTHTVTTSATFPPSRLTQNSCHKMGLTRIQHFGFGRSIYVLFDADGKKGPRCWVMLSFTPIYFRFRDYLGFRARECLIAYPGFTSLCEHEKSEFRAFLAGFNNHHISYQWYNKCSTGSSQMIRRTLVHLQGLWTPKNRNP